MFILPLTLFLLAAPPAARPAPPPPQELQLLGTVGEFDVRMSLTLSPGHAAANYAYATGTSNIFLSGPGLAADGRLQLTEEAHGPEETESFHGALDLQRRQFTGAWKKGNRTLPFSLSVFARVIPLGLKGHCGAMRVLAFELQEAALSQALTAAARTLAEQAIKAHCTPGEDFGGSQELSAMTDGLVSIRTSYGNGLPKGSGSQVAVLDTRVTPPRELKIEDGAVDARKLRLALAREADRVLRQGDPELLQSVSGILKAEDRLDDRWSSWALTPAGVQLWYRQNDWAASGDGTVHVLVRRGVLVGLYRPDSRLGTWARGSTSP